MTNIRGEKQTEFVMFRCSQTDKATLKKEAQKRGVSMSVLLKNVLIDARLIDPTNPTTKW